MPWRKVRARVSLPVSAKAVTGDSIAPHYLRFIVDDKPGIVSAISGALSKVGANIDSLLQRRGIPKASAAVCGDDGALFEFHDSGGGGDRSREMDCMLVRPLSLEMLVVDDKDEETA